MMCNLEMITKIQEPFGQNEVLNIMNVFFILLNAITQYRKDTKHHNNHHDICLLVVIKKKF